VEQKEERCQGSGHLVVNAGCSFTVLSLSVALLNFLYGTIRTR
jgi:hypothetical protein